MNIAQITETLEKIYREDEGGGNRIVFWDDPQGEFTENLDALVPEGVQLLRLDQMGALAAKIRIEIEEPQGKFLVYSPHPETAPENLDRSALDIKSGTILKRKKRCVIDPQIPPQDNAWHGKIKNTPGTQGEMEFLIPKGANRFHFSGGAKFVHGGAMPQEICVPLLSIRKLRGKTAESQAVTRVGVTLLGNLTRIVNNVQRFEFIQTETVAERTLPRNLQISLRDEAGNTISNEQTVTFDSASNSMDERRKSVQLTLRAGSYDRTKDYYLVLIDNDSVIKEYLRLRVILDIAFSSDF